jgi:hypothetical protein
MAEVPEPAAPVAAPEALHPPADAPSVPVAAAKEPPAPPAPPAAPSMGSFLLKLAKSQVGAVATGLAGAVASAAAKAGAAAAPDAAKAADRTDAVVPALVKEMKTVRDTAAVVAPRAAAAAAVAVKGEAVAVTLAALKDATPGLLAAVAAPRSLELEAGRAEAAARDAAAALAAARAALHAASVVAAKADDSSAAREACAAAEEVHKAEEAREKAAERRKTLKRLKAEEAVQAAALAKVEAEQATVLAALDAVAAPRDDLTSQQQVAADALAQVARIRLLRAQAGRSMSLRAAAREAVGADGGMFSSVAALLSKSRAVVERLPDVRCPELKSPLLQALPAVRLENAELLASLKRESETRGCVTSDFLENLLTFHTVTDTTARRRAADWVLRNAAEQTDALLKAAEDAAAKAAADALAALPDNAARNVVLRAELRAAIASKRRVDVLRSKLGTHVGCRDAATEALAIAAGPGGGADKALRDRCRYLGNEQRADDAARRDSIPLKLLLVDSNAIADIGTAVQTTIPHAPGGAPALATTAAARGMKLTAMGRVLDEAYASSSSYKGLSKEQLKELAERCTKVNSKPVSDAQLAGWWALQDEKTAVEALDAAAAFVETRWLAAQQQWYPWGGANAPVGWVQAHLPNAKLERELYELISTQSRRADEIKAAEATLASTRDGMKTNEEAVAVDGFDAAALKGAGSHATAAANAALEALKKTKNALMKDMLTARDAALQALADKKASGAAALLEQCGIAGAAKRLLEALRQEDYWKQLKLQPAELEAAREALAARAGEAAAPAGLAAAAAASQALEAARAAEREARTARRKLRDALLAALGKLLKEKRMEQLRIRAGQADNDARVPPDGARGGGVCQNCGGGCRQSRCRGARHRCGGGIRAGCCAERTGCHIRVGASALGAAVSVYCSNPGSGGCGAAGKLDRG